MLNPSLADTSPARVRKDERRGVARMSIPNIGDRVIVRPEHRSKFNDSPAARGEVLTVHKPLPGCDPIVSGQVQIGPGPLDYAHADELVQVLVPITINQLRAAMHPDDWADHVVTHRDAELLGLSSRYEDAEAKFHAWMNANDWLTVEQAAGCVRWRRKNDTIWLGGTVEYQVAEFISVLREDAELPWSMGRVSKRDMRPSLEILAEILNTQPTAEHRTAAEQWDGGGTFVLVTR